MNIRKYIALLFLFLIIPYVSAGGNSFICEFDKSEYMGVFGELINVKLNIHNTTSCSDLDNSYQLSSSGSFNCNNGGPIQYVNVNPSACNQTIQFSCTYAEIPAINSIVFSIYNFFEGSPIGQISCSSVVSISPPPAPQLVNLVITPTNQSAEFSWETRHKDGTKYTTNNFLKIGLSAGSLHQVFLGTADPYISFTNHSLLNNTQYFYEIKSCDINDATNCNSTTGSFTTLQTDLSVSPSPSPSASPAAERHDLIAVLAGPSDVPKGTQAFFTASIENAGNRDETFNLRVRDVTGIVETSIYTENNIAISAGSKITRSFEWNTASAAEGIHTITATASLLNYLESTPSDNSYDLTVTVTAAQTLPLISNVRVSTVTTSSAIIQWNTDIPSDSNVFYGISRLGDNPARDTARKTAHSITLSSLQPATTYVYKVQSCDQTACASSAEMRFTTGSDPEGVCAPKNYCKTGEAVYVKFAEIQGVCVEQGKRAKSLKA